MVRVENNGNAVRFCHIMNVLSAGNSSQYSSLLAFKFESFPGRECTATIGQVSNVDQEKVSLGKAGRNRWRGRRPSVRGVAMNPVDHPLGGGEGKSSGGRHPVTPWGVPTKGYKTRSRKKPSNKFIVKRRK